MGTLNLNGNGGDIDYAQTRVDCHGAQCFWWFGVTVVVAGHRQCAHCNQATNHETEESLLLYLCGGE